MSISRTVENKPEKKNFDNFSYSYSVSTTVFQSNLYCIVNKIFVACA